MYKAGLSPRDDASHRTSQGNAAKAAPATVPWTRRVSTVPWTRQVATVPWTRQVVLRRTPAGFGLFEALIEPSAALVWLVTCVRLGGDSFDSRYLIVGAIAFSLTFPGAMRFNDSPRIAFAKAWHAAVLVVSALALIGYA